MVVPLLVGLLSLGIISGPCVGNLSVPAHGQPGGPYPIVSLVGTHLYRNAKLSQQAVQLKDTALSTKIQ